MARRAAAKCKSSGKNPVALSALTRLEFVSAVAKCVRIRRTDSATAQDALSTFEYHCLHEFALLPVLPSDYELAQHWLRQLSTSLRTMDALHMAVAVANGRTLVTADRQLAEAAKVFGVEHHFVSYA